MGIADLYPTFELFEYAQQAVAGPVKKHEFWIRVEVLAILEQLLRHFFALCNEAGILFKIEFFDFVQLP